MRAIITIIVAMFGLTGVMLVGAPVVETLGDEVGSNSAVQEQIGTSVIDGIEQAVVEWTVYVFIFSMIAYGVIWYVRRERFTGGRVR